MLSLEPHLLEPRPLPVHPRLAAAMAEGPPAVRDLMDPVGVGVVRVPLLDPVWSLALARGVRAVEERARDARVPLQNPNSMHSYGVLAADLALDPLVRELVATLVLPLAADLFPEVGGATLDEHHAFVVHYGDDWDRDLSLHVDDSDVTVNICLGETFEGGELLMSGRRCAGHLGSAGRPGERFAVHQEPGVAILHAGMHRHEALPVTGGERLNLIVWCRSSTYRRERGQGCAEWCGLHVGGGSPFAARP